MDRSDIKTISQLIKHLDEKYLMSRDSTNYSEKLKSMREMQSAISIVVFATYCVPIRFV